MLVFYAGAFGYAGHVTFDPDGRGCTYNEPVEIEENMSISAAIPVHEQDISSIAGQNTEGGVEVDAARIPSAIMHLSEYYMAVRAALQDEIQVVILDRTLAGDVGHLVWNVAEMLQENSCVLLGAHTPYGNVTSLDLELARMLHPNEKLKIPVARSHFIKYSAINHLIKESESKSKSKSGKKADSTIPDAALTYENLLAAIGAKKGRIEKLKKDMARFGEKYSILDGNTGLSLDSEIGRYWERVFSASMRLCDYIFNTPDGSHPLLLDPSVLAGGDDDDNKTGTFNPNRPPRWITASDLDYLVLIMAFALLRLAWDRNLLVLGMIKDVSAGELTKTVVPLLQAAGKLCLSKELPRFNSDKMLLQTASVINASDIQAPWRSIEFDACFRTVAPLHESSAVLDGANPAVNVAGAFKNVISAERMFVKAYVQLWQSDSDRAVRSHVFSYDRPCYPGFDTAGLRLVHKDNEVDEEIIPVLHFENDSPISHLVMDILCSMAQEVIPEALGHNYPLFLADKKAKTVLEGSKNAYLSTISFEMANNGLDQQVLFQARFREYRSEIESKRRVKA
jgi:hypothetical protein